VNDTTESVRLAKIDSYGVIGRSPHPDLQALVGLAAHVCDVPSAAITLLTDSDQQVAAVGSEPSGQVGETRFIDVHDLVAPDGLVIGSLSVRDARPRTLTPDQHGALRILADRVVDALEHRLCSRLLEQALAELAAQREAVRDATEQNAMFADQVTHDLRNPMTAVSMALQMLREQPSVAADDDAAWMVTRALDGTQRIDSLLENLLETRLSRARSCRVDPTSAGAPRRPTSRSPDPP